MITAVIGYIYHISLYYCDSSADEPVVSADSICQDVFIVTVATMRIHRYLYYVAAHLEISGNMIDTNTDGSSFGIRVCRCFGYSLFSSYCLSVHVLGCNHGNIVGACNRDRGVSTATKGPKGAKYRQMEV